MKIIQQSHSIIEMPKNPLELIEIAGRTCYKSEDKISKDSAKIFVGNLLNSKHESVFEHVSVTVRFITNRGVTHELVRHRLCAYSQESTRFVKYDKNKMEFVEPVWWNDWNDDQKNIWISSMENSEKMYVELIKSGAKPEQAREVLPNSLKTEIVVTANLRQWRHIFELRCHNRAHPQIKYLMRACCNEFKKKIPLLFDEIKTDESEL